MSTTIEITGKDAVAAELERVCALGYVTRDTIDPDPEIGNRRLVTVVGSGEPCEAYDLVIYEPTKYRGPSMRVTVRPVTQEEAAD